MHGTLPVDTLDAFSSHYAIRADATPYHLVAVGLYVHGLEYTVVHYSRYCNGTGAEFRHRTLRNFVVESWSG